MNCNGDGGSTTIQLTNPGIILRLDQDIADYLSPFGYELTYPSEDDGTDVNTAVLTIPVLRDAEPPIKTLHIHIHDEDLVPTIGPLIRTYLRLSDAKLHPKRLRAIVDCWFTVQCKDTAVDNAEDAAAKRMAHHIHMLIRNSMGSALCLDLVVVLPFYFRETETAHLTIPAIRTAMDNNADTCYTNVTLRTRDSEEGSSDFSEFKSHTSTFHVHVNTRMCTVRHQPKLFRWLASPSSFDKSHSYNQTNEIKKAKSQTVIACIEKVANLHRILMLCYDYDNDVLNGNNSGNDIGIVDKSALLLLNVIVVIPRMENENHISTESCVPSSSKKKKIPKSLLQHYDEAIQHFHSVVFGKHKQQFKFYRPKIVYEDESVDEMRFISTSNDSRHIVLGIDLHPDALTLCGDYEAYMKSNNSHPQHVLQTAPTYHAMHELQKAKAIVFGYESTGIPACIQKCLNAWVQIPSRSSINVVASMSILFDALYRK